MGFLDLFKSSSKPKNLDKYGDVLRKVVTTKEQRLEAIDALRSEKPEQSIPQLLKRFEIVIDHGMQDTKEKELVTEIIVSHKDIARTHIATEIGRARRVAWLIRLAEKLFSPEDYVTLLLENLSQEFVGFDESIQDRNIEIMLALKDANDPRILDRVAFHFDSRDEQVRVAAMECIEAQATHSERARELLKSRLTGEVNDANARFVGLLRGIVEKHGW